VALSENTKFFVGINSNWRERMVHTLHNSNLDGHLGIMDTYQRVKEDFLLAKHETRGDNSGAIM
jgi:hypothetical protein